MIPDDLIEAVAREACHQMGLDPDEFTWGVDDDGREVFWRRWKVMRGETRTHIAFARAVKMHDKEGV